MSSPLRYQPETNETQFTKVSNQEDGIDDEPKDITEYNFTQEEIVAALNDTSFAYSLTPKQPPLSTQTIYIYILR